MKNSYDAAIIGGGLAGLALSIQLSKLGYSVVLFEKEKYPFHKVCGEYISRESWDFLERLGIDLKSLDVSTISHLQISSVNGKILEQKLPLGGFGISRFRLDHELSKIARDAGVIIEEETKVTDVVFDQLNFIINAGHNVYKVKLAFGSFGKRSNLDIKWRRGFVTAQKNKLNNYIGVKYHIRSGFPSNTIALHSFPGGYCGIVKIEADKYNLCYLTTAGNLIACGNNIKEMERTILAKNPHLKKIWEESVFLDDTQSTISQISFDKKSQVEEHMLMIGDAAGMITPLCGNGMSMALHGSKLACEEAVHFLHGQITRDEMENNYTMQWQHHFAGRLKSGRMIQRLFGNNPATNLIIGLARVFPSISRFVIKQTHGKPF